MSQNIKERHVLVDVGFAVGGSLVGGSFLATPVRGCIAFVVGVLVLVAAVIFDRRTVAEEEHEIAQARYDAQHPWETES